MEERKKRSGSLYFDGPKEIQPADASNDEEWWMHALLLRAAPTMPAKQEIMCCVVSLTACLF
jgi:hypothetical protein